MNRAILLAAALLLVPYQSFGQTVTAPTYQGTDGQTKEALGTFSVGSSGAAGGATVGSPTPSTATVVAGSDGTTVRTLRTDPLGQVILAGSSLTGVKGQVASGATDAGEPVKVGGFASVSPPAGVSAGQRVNAWYGLNGQATVQLADAGGSLSAVTNVGDAAPNQAMLNVRASGFVYNGVTWDRQRDVNSANGTTGIGVPASGILAAVNSTFPSYVSGTMGELQINSRGHLYVSNYSTSSVSADARGPNFTGQGQTEAVGFNMIFNGTNWDRGRTASSADATTGTGLMGAGILGQYQTTLPTYTAGQFGTLAMTAKGVLSAALADSSGASVNTAVGNTDAISQGDRGLVTYSRVQMFDPVGGLWTRARGDATGAYVVQTPTAAAANSITPVVGSLVSSIVAKAAPGNLYSASITTGAAAVYLYVFNATAAPADGAVVAGTGAGQYQLCSTVAASTTFTSTFEIPDRYSVGVVPVVSSTACGTLTKVATATFLKARVQ
jgi:hypothetical protein